ncbi:MAG: ATP-grasp domain-containing protein [Thermodesulfobacteriota bacterium]|nr:ATP-grasp domain-containing protein [Thermodesulfobacteriota bacterium]
MNLLFSCIGKRGYIADYFRPHLPLGSRIVATSNTPATPGFLSCDSAVLMPDIKSNQYVDALLALCRQEAAQGLLSFFDPDVMALSAHLADFRAVGVVPILPSKVQARIAFDKLETYRFLTLNGIETPKTFADLPTAIKALEEGSITLPVYVKPRFGFGSRHHFVAGDINQLRAFFGAKEHMIMQERILGDEYNIDMCSDLDGQVLAVVPWRKYLSRMGETEHAVTCEYPELLELGVNLGKLTGHPGPLDADLIVRDGRVWVLELNIRFGGGYPVSHLAGADFPGLLVQMLRGRRPRPEIGNYRRDVVMMKKLVPFGGHTPGFTKEQLHVQRSMRTA